FSSALAFVNYLLMPASILSWGGAFGNYLTGDAGYLTTLLKPIGVAAVLLASALVFIVVVYNVNFDFLLAPFQWLKKKNEVQTTAEMQSGLTTGSRLTTEFRDTDENIFAKDNIAGEVMQEPINLEVSNEEDQKIIDINSRLPAGQAG